MTFEEELKALCEKHEVEILEETEATVNTFNLDNKDKIIVKVGSDDFPASKKQIEAMSELLKRFREEDHSALIWNHAVKFIVLKRKKPLVNPDGTIDKVIMRDEID